MALIAAPLSAAQSEQGSVSGTTSLALYRSAVNGSESAVRELRVRADAGNAEAEWHLGRLYHEGEVVSKDLTQCAVWLRKAAEQGYAPAQGDLGHMYAIGDGLPKDLSQAVPWVRKAAEQGNALAQAYLGTYYRDGNGLPKDMAQAAQWYLKAAEQGNVFTQESLGYIFATGDGVERDIPAARKWLERASAQGSDYAKNMLPKLDSQQTKGDKGDVTGGAILWTNYNGGEYSLSLYNRRKESIRNVVCQVIFYDRSGGPVDTDTIHYQGTIPAGLPKRLSGKVDASVRDFTTKFKFGAPGDEHPGYGYAMQPETKVEVRVVDFETVP